MNFTKIQRFPETNKQLTEDFPQKENANHQEMNEKRLYFQWH